MLFLSAQSLTLSTVLCSRLAFEDYYSTVAILLISLLIVTRLLLFLKNTLLIYLYTYSSIFCVEEFIENKTKSIKKLHAHRVETRAGGYDDQRERVKIDSQHPVRNDMAHGRLKLFSYMYYMPCQAL